jgi:hypothetical protein
LSLLPAQGTEWFETAQGAVFEGHHPDIQSSLFDYEFILKLDPGLIVEGHQ